MIELDEKSLIDMLSNAISLVRQLEASLGVPSEMSALRPKNERRAIRRQQSRHLANQSQE